jgi:hypothetical protein
LTTVIELKCPYCQNSLSSEEYQLALLKFKKNAEDEFNAKLIKERLDFEQELRSLKENNKLEIENIKNQTLRDLSVQYESQISTLKNENDKLQKLKEKEIDQIVGQRTSDMEEELYQKDNEIKELHNKFRNIKQEAMANAINSLQTEIDIQKDKVLQKEIQIKRAQEETEKLRRQLYDVQAEIKGEVGEINLLDKLKNAFQQDIINRTSRGVECGDVIHQIKLPSGNLLDTKIVYDNKNASTVTSNDLEKAKKYMQIHHTEHVIIVSKNLPKREIKNGLFGEIRGILLVHPSIIVEVAYQIRKAIIDLSRLSMSCNEKNTKQSKIYEYITSREFNHLIENICIINKLNQQIQNEEERQHNSIWKKRKKLDQQLKSLYFDISNGINSIIEDDFVTDK